MNYKQPKQGFTLIELLVVVLIIGILAAVALPQYQKAVTKSRAAQVDVSFNIAKKNIETYILANGWPTEYVFFSGTNNAGDLEMPGDCSTTAGACFTSVGTFTSTCIPNNYCQVAFSSPINMKDWVGITLAYNSKVGGWFVLLLQSGNAKATCEWIEEHPEYKIYSPEKAKCTSSGVTLSNQVVSSWW